MRAGRSSWPRAASLEAGITSFHDAGANFTTIDLFKQAAADGSLGVRLWVMIRDSNDNLRAKLAQYKAVGLNNHHLTIAAIKVTADGALGSRGALMLEPYTDSPSSTGLATVPIESIADTAKIAIDNGVQLCVHAIGDRANREVLNVYERTFAQYPAQKDLRWRIEHAQHIHPADIPRFGKLGVIAAMQGIHATSDAPYVLARLGPDARAGRRLRVAEADAERRDRRQRHRRAGGAHRSDGELPRHRHAQDEGRLGVLRRSEDDARAGAEVLHLERRVCGEGRIAEGIAAPSASSPTSPCCRKTS